MKNRMVSIYRYVQWTMLVILVVAVVALSVDIPSVRSNGFQHYSILAESMQPLDSTIQFNNISAYLLTTTNSTYTTATATYIAQVNLPDGAVINGINVYGIDSDSTQNFGAGLYRYNQDNVPVWESVTAFTSTAGTPGKVVLHLTPLSSALATINNQNYSYGIYIGLPRPLVILGDGPPNLGVLRIVVDWGHSTFLPVVSK